MKDKTNNIVEHFNNIINIIIGKGETKQIKLNTLINELKKYKNSKDDIIKFFINIKLIEKYSFKLSIIKRIKLKKALIEVNNFLIHTYYEKIKQYTKNENDIIIAMNLFINLLGNIKLDIGFNDSNIKNIEYKEKKLTL